MPSNNRQTPSFVQLGIAKIICEKCGDQFDNATIEEIEVEMNCYKNPESMDKASDPKTKRFMMLCDNCRNNPVPFYNL